MMVGACVMVVLTALSLTTVSASSHGAPVTQPVMDVLTRVIGEAAAGQFDLAVDATMNQVKQKYLIMYFV